MFAVDPSEIQHLDGLQLVRLLRVLLYAEARKADVPLRNVDVPLQITIADGGQDAIVQWQDGEEATDYFPGRDVVFQCKATDHGDAQWKKEVWTKKSQRKRVKVLNEAVAAVLERGGSYVGVTATPLVGSKADDRAAAIKEGIRAAGGDPAKLAAVQVYDGNKLAAWASSHPAVALWVKEQKAGVPFAGFATLDQWGKRADVAIPPFVGDASRAFSLGANRADLLDFTQLAGRLVDHLSAPRACARIWGASGIGKTRALHQALSTSMGALRDLAVANFIFCDFRDVSTRIWDVANQIKNEGSPAVLVVDACSWEDSRRLFELARAEGSQLRVITLGAEGRDQIADCLSIRPQPADLETIKGILANGLPKAAADEIDYIAQLCDGFPRIAVLVAGSYSKQGILKSADDVAQQIIQSAGLDRDTVRALECLSLFERLSPDADPKAFDSLAETLAHMTGGLMFERLVMASEQHLVGRNNDQMNARPRPIADYLAMRRLSYLRPSTVIDFLFDAAPTHRHAMLSRWRYLARSLTLIEVVRLILRGPFADAKVLLGDEAAPFLPSLVHVDPDATGTALYWSIMQMPLDELAHIPATSDLLDALRLLASRQSSFKPAAQMVLRLAAVADTEGSPPILDLLRQLFQVALAGTEADDRRRREALTDALDDDDPRIRRACVEALGAMLQTYISRSADFEQVGAEPYRAEWTPADQETIFSYFRWALERLLEVWRASPDQRERIEKHVADDLRNLLAPELLPTIETFAVEVVAAKGHWFEATKSVGDWLYFDRPDPPTDFAKAVRVLYDATLPIDPVEQVLLYSRFWTADIHDPDTRYAETVHELDFEYSSRRAKALAPAIAGDAVQLARVIVAMSSEELNGPGAFAEALAAHVADPLDAMTQAVTALDANGTRAGAGFVRALLAALDRRLTNDPVQTERLEAIANGSTVLAASPMNIYTALRVTDERLARLSAQVRAGEIAVAHVVPISYGRGLADVSTDALTDLIEALVDQVDEGGAWAALEILSMVTHEQKRLAPEIANLTKIVILSPAITNEIDGHLGNADYNHDRMIKLLSASGFIDGNFARSFALQIENACQSVGGKQGRPSDALRNALAIVVKHAPEEVWAVLAGFYEIGSRVERKRLDLIIAPTKPFASNASRVGAGPLFDTPINVMLDWVAQEPDGRIAFLVSFFPILTQVEDDWTWHPALQQLADSYGGSKQFRSALRSRIFPNSWSGSLNPHLAGFRAPLAAWAGESKLGDWASATLEAIDHSLQNEFHRE
ncbi:hypothetical protein [Novosphingobium sp. JCM 18896]|uniref:hypothetical protein n=1 Tax=Novosphingobium sp. JCM 18896 TaxID=2989731 RepID=UPI0022220684|nr:hypothetical protein [Novosphingobium sp. JCM 18896]MCW1432155.1 hypothetical protein [Novosphingobium sp. JCM 18896]